MSAESYSPTVTLTATMSNNRLAFFAGRLTMAKTLKDAHFVQYALADLREEVARINAVLEAYDASPDPDAVPDASDTANTAERSEREV